MYRGGALLSSMSPLRRRSSTSADARSSCPFVYRRRVPPGLKGYNWYGTNRNTDNGEDRFGSSASGNGTDGEENDVGAATMYVAFQIDVTELQLAHALFRGVALRDQLATCLAVRRQHDIVKAPKTQLTHFQNVHQFFTEVEADLLSVIMARLSSRQDIQVQTILPAEKYLGHDTLAIVHELGAFVGPLVNFGTGMAFAHEILDLAKVVLNEAPDEFVRISRSLAERALHEYTHDISMCKLPIRRLGK